jgi:hypothetical protein
MRILRLSNECPDSPRKASQACADPNALIPEFKVYNFDAFIAQLGALAHFSPSVYQNRPDQPSTTFSIIIFINLTACILGHE